MATFAYTGRTRAGQNVTGERVADSMDAAVAALRRDQILVTNINPVKDKGKAKSGRAKGVNSKRLAVFTRQFSVMIDAGLPLVQCLEILGTQEEDKAFSATILATRSDVESGASLADAMKKHPKTFDPLFTNMVAAGEAGGILDTILKRLATYIEKNVKLKSQVKSAMIYPVAVIVIAAAVVTVILWKVIPTFANLFAGLGAELPLPTRVVIAMSNGVVLFMPYMIVTLVGAFFAFRTYYATPGGRMLVDRITLKLPILGMLMRKIAVARFCRTLSTLLASGVSILEALDITAKTAGNAVVEASVLTTRKSIERGETIAQPLRETAVFPSMVVQMIGVGEATGALDTMLSKIADFYEEEVDIAVAGLLTLLEPVMIAFLGTVVGGIVIAMYMPIFGLIAKLTGVDNTPNAHTPLEVIAARLVVGTLLLGSAIVIDIARPESYPVDPLVCLIGLMYALSVIYLIMLRAVERLPALIDLQFAFDAVLVSAFIHLTGGIASHFSSLYTLPIIAASTVRGRRGALQVAWLSATLYTGIVFAQYLDIGLLPSGWWTPLATDLPTPGFAKYTVVINLSGMCAVAALSGSLAERLRSARAGLEDASYEIADLRAFNDHLVDSLASGLVTTDATGRVLTFNRAAARIVGVPVADAIGRDVRDVLQIPMAMVPGGLEGVHGRRLEVPFSPRVGEPLDIGLTIAPLQFPEGTAGHLIAFQDITGIKRLERETRLQQRLAAVGEMAAGIAHEIRNPLASVFGSLQLVRSEVAFTDEQRELMDIALRESERLNERIRLFLVYARPQQFTTAPVVLSRVIHEAVHQLRHSVDAREGHEIVADVPADEDWVECDEAEVRQILWSLGTNGLRAMEKGGRLSVSARIESHGTGTSVVLVVQDQGCGIPAAEVDQIFQPFRRAFPQGSGLGLAIVHRIVTDHEGDVQVSSEAGVGTTVRVRLPVRDADRTEAVERLADRRSA